MIVAKQNQETETFKSKPIKSFHYGINEAMRGHIFKMLRNDIYSDKMLACVREYSCNAIDANIEAGKTARDVTIYMPNDFESCLIIEDKGVGLDLEGVEQVFANYGSSTKRDSNDGIGCLGIGSKAAFSYTDAFTIETVKDGVERIFISSIEGGTDSEDSGGIDFVSETPTDKPNGVRIKVPIRKSDFARCEDSIRNFMQFQDPKNCPKVVGVRDILFLGFDHEEKVSGSNRSWGIRTVGDSADGRKNHLNLHRSYAMMGPVPYQIDSHRLRSVTDDKGNQIVSNRIITMMERFPILFRFEMGEINFGPSREEIAYNEITARCIQSLGEVIHERMMEEAQAAYSDVKNLYEAIVAYRKNSVVARFFLKDGEIKLPDGILLSDVVRGSISLPRTTRKLADGREVRELTGNIEVNRCFYDRRWKKNSIDFLPIAPDYTYVIMDTPKSGYTQRLTNLHDSLSFKQRIILIEIHYEAEFRKWIRDTGIEGNISFLKLSDYERILTQNEKLVRKTRGQIFEYDRRDYSDVNSDRWNKVEGEIDFSEKIYWVPIYSFKPQIGGKTIDFNRFNSLIEKAVECEEIDFSEEDASHIIGVKNTVKCKAIEEFRKEKGCVDVIEYLREQIMKYYEKQDVLQILSDADHFSNTICTYDVLKSNSGLKELRKEIDKYLKSESPFVQLLKKMDFMKGRFECRDKVDLGLLDAVKNLDFDAKLKEYPKPTYDLNEVFKQFRDHYPMIEFADCYSYTSSWHNPDGARERFIKSFLNYVSAIDSGSINT